LKRLLRRFFRLVVALLLLVILVLCGLTLPLRWIMPATSAYMVADRHSNQRAVHHLPVAGENISAHLKLAVIAAEDQSFPHHHGFDIKQIRDAVESHRGGKPLRGASTISQQLARNLYLWPGGGWFRKGLEAMITVPLELFVPKRRLLEIYLNTVEFGPGIYGAEAAARHYFKKPAAELSRAEAALLAAVLPSPKTLNAGQPDEYLRQRQHWILGQMDNLGFGWVPAD